MSTKVEIKQNKKPSNGKVSVKKNPNLPTQKDIILPENFSPEDEELIEVSMRAMEAIKREIKRGTFQ